MKIVKEGDLQKDWKKTIKCKPEKHTCPTDKPACGAELEISEADLILLYYKGNFGGHHFYAGVRCSSCGKINSVGGVPEFVWERLTKNQKAQFDGWQDERDW